MDVSVIIPCYNVANYIEKTIKSLSEQNYRNFEAIFVDDCSVDNSVDVIQDYINQYNIIGKLVKCEKNSGPSIARKIGIENSESKYITFCDSDDWYEPDFLDKMIKKSNNMKNDIVFCNYSLAYDSGKKINKVIFNDENYIFDKKIILTQNIDSMCVCMFKRSLFDELVFPNIKNGEDMAIIPILINKAESFGIVVDYIYNYYQRQGSLSTTVSDTIVNDLYKSFVYIESNLSCEFSKEIEFLGIRNFLYGSILALYKESYKNKFIVNKILNNFNNKYPQWYKNVYFKRLPIHKKIFLLTVRFRLNFCTFILAYIHTKLTC